MFWVICTNFLGLKRVLTTRGGRKRPYNQPLKSAVIEAKPKFEEARAKRHYNALVLLDLKNAHNAYERATAQRALGALAATDPSPRPLLLARHSTSSQNYPTYARSSQTKTGPKYLCESSAGGGQGNTLTSMSCRT